MSEQSPSSKKHEKILIITSSGGGGLIQTANAKEQEALAKNPNVQIVRYDLLKDWMWGPIGRFSINFWNNAQKKGDVFAQRLCVAGHFLVDMFVHPIIFFYALRTLFKEDVDHIMDTQVLGTSAVIRALRIYNYRKKKKVLLEKVLVDMPTRKATHFFRPIKKLSRQGKKLIQLTTIKPLLEGNETAEEFWQSTCGLPLKSVNVEEVYVRQAFRAYQNKGRVLESMDLKVRYKNKEELKLMQKAFQKGEIKFDIRDKEISFHVAPEDRVITVLLGSQPAKEATLNYVKNVIDFVKEAPKVTTHLFVFCADHTPRQDSLLKQVANFVAKAKNYPKNLSIVPFSFQKEDVIAPLFFRSDMTCTRSGGQTVMELMCVATGDVCIHSEAKKGQNLLSGIPGWEAASAVYFQKVRGAKIITPDTFISNARTIFQIDTQAASSSRALESTA